MDEGNRAVGAGAWLGVDELGFPRRKVLDVGG